MAGTGTIKITKPGNEFEAINPIVSIVTRSYVPVYNEDGTTQDEPKLVNAINPEPRLTCLSIQNNVGITPATAVLKFIPGSDLSAPNTLAPTPGFIAGGASSGIQLGSRIVIQHKTEKGKNINLFFGQLTSRLDQGATDEIRFQAIDDRYWLSKIPVRGCIVRDTSASKKNAKLITRFPARTNPGGNWNCVGTKIGDTVWPTFYQTSILGKSYESPDEAFTTTLKDGEVSAWTPRRFLLYLNLLANSKAWDFEGMQELYWRSLVSDFARLKWDVKTILGLRGTDESGVRDPLDAKMPDMNFQGQMIGLCIDKTLKVAGTHVLSISISPTQPADKVPFSNLIFVPIGMSAISSSTGKELKIAMHGDIATRPESIYDFQMKDDISLSAPSVLVEGSTIKLETELAYTGSATDTLKPAWTVDEENMFKAIITGDSEDYAKIPKYQGNLEIENMVLADGNNNTPLIPCGTVEAVRLARQCLPNVFRAFYVDSSNLLSQMQGIPRTVGGDKPYLLEEAFPVLQGEKESNISARPIAPTQEQFLTTQLSATDEIAARMLTKYPVRIQTKTNGEWADSQYVSGIKVTSDGLLWFDGLNEAVDGKSACIYEGTLVSVDNSAVELKDLKMNCVVPMDHRVIGFKSSQMENIDQSFLEAIGGSPLLYIDSPNAYTEVHQVDSTPASTIQFRNSDHPGIEHTLLAPLNRYLPPGSEIHHAEYAADRKLAYSKNPSRSTEWRYAGIRLDQKIGQYIYLIYQAGEGYTTGNFYTIKNITESLLFDFENQITIIGGGTSRLGSNL